MNKRSKSLSAMSDNSSNNGDDEISIKKELKAIPMSMKWIQKSYLTAATSSNVDEHLLILLTTNGTIILNEVRNVFVFALSFLHPFCLLESHGD